MGPLLLIWAAFPDLGGQHIQKKRKAPRRKAQARRRI
jgi:hypothetical protein